MHRAILLNNRLYYYKIVDSQLRTFCGRAKEDYRHLFFECETAKEIANKCIEYIKINAYIEIEWSCKNLLLNPFPVRGFVKSISSSTTCFSITQALIDRIA